MYVSGAPFPTVVSPFQSTGNGNFTPDPFTRDQFQPHNGWCGGQPPGCLPAPPPGMQFRGGTFGCVPLRPTPGFGSLPFFGPTVPLPINWTAYPVPGPSILEGPLCGPWPNGPFPFPVPTGPVGAPTWPPQPPPGWPTDPGGIPPAQPPGPWTPMPYPDDPGDTTPPDDPWDPNDPVDNPDQ